MVSKSAIVGVAHIVEVSASNMTYCDQIRLTQRYNIII